MTFIEKLNLTADLSLIQKDVDTILTHTNWGEENQIGLTHRPSPVNDVWKDCVGSLYDRTTGIELYDEREFTEVNPLVPDYLKSKLLELAELENFTLGRVRLMQLLPKRGLTVHSDTSVRYHLVLKTNPYSYISHTFSAGNISALCFHLPADSTFYKVDTTRPHFVYNGGQDPRIHLVICPI